MWQTKIFISTVGIVLLFLLAVVFLGPVLFASIAYPLPEQYRPAIAKWTNEYCQGIPDSANLLAGLIYTESTWKVTAASHAGAVGLTQFIPSTARAVAKRLGIENFTPSQLTKDPELAIRFGAHYICGRINDYGGNITLGLIAYNGGGGAVNAYRAGSPVRGTVQYANKVQAVGKAYRSIYGDWAPGYLTNAAIVDPTSDEFAVQPKTSPTDTTYDVVNFWQGLLTSPEAVNTDEEQSGGVGDFFRGLFQIR